jgi:hypothetical protein
MIRKLTIKSIGLSKSRTTGLSRYFAHGKDETPEELEKRRHMQKELKDRIDQRVQEDLARKAGTPEGFRAV